LRINFFNYDLIVIFFLSIFLLDYNKFLFLNLKKKMVYWWK